MTGRHARKMGSTPPVAVSKSPLMRRLILALAIVLGPAAAFAAAPAVKLWNGHDLTGWSFVTSPAVDIATVCHATPDGVLAAAGRPIGYLLAGPETYANFKLHVEWRWPAKPGNGGVLVHISSGPKDRQWPLCFQVQLKVHRAGDILPMAGATCAEQSPPSTRSASTAKRRPGPGTPAISSAATARSNARSTACRKTASPNARRPPARLASSSRARPSNCGTSNLPRCREPGRCQDPPATPGADAGCLCSPRFRPFADCPRLAHESMPSPPV